MGLHYLRSVFLEQISDIKRFIIKKLITIYFIVGLHYLRSVFLEQISDIKRFTIKNKIQKQ